MKRLTICLSILALLLLGKSPVVFAQFFQAGVQQFKTPVAAPDFKLERLGGGEVSLKEFRGKLVILNFYTTW
jgi:cytochrome oxidase Cu insertion factor (SCO1/SenC/PrrC family)